ncbi:hypothetical protein [Acinetobacter lactucae]|uniref:hypothetical protein n=1 Tax=Acinetobacter lactucae TaxID=1785128 RepID=UPI001580C4A0|nr:hypothetical protein [Acinetobacter lactucae]NUG49697.1 hypothetical protein [Acinetobacter lactucae]
MSEIEFKQGDYVFLKEPVTFQCGTTKNKELARIIRIDGLEVDLMFKGDHKTYLSWIGDIRYASIPELQEMLKEVKAESKEG